MSIWWQAGVSAKAEKCLAWRLWRMRPVMPEQPGEGFLIPQRCLYHSCFSHAEKVLGL